MVEADSLKSLGEQIKQLGDGLGSASDLQESKSHVGDLVNTLNTTEDALKAAASS